MSFKGTQLTQLVQLVTVNRLFLACEGQVNILMDECLYHKCKFWSQKILTPSKPSVKATNPYMGWMIWNSDRLLSVLHVSKTQRPKRVGKALEETESMHSGTMSWEWSFLMWKQVFRWEGEKICQGHSTLFTPSAWVTSLWVTAPLYGGNPSLWGWQTVISGRLSLLCIGQVECTRSKRRLPTCSFNAFLGNECH